MAGEKAVHGQCPRTEEWTIKLETSQSDPLLGETYVQFGWKGLKHQLSQGAGAWNPPEGQRFSYYKLIDSAMPGSRPWEPPELTRTDFFEGIDTSLPGLASRLGTDQSKVPWLRPQLQAIAQAVDEATGAADKDSQSAGGPLLQGLDLTRALISKVEASGLSGAEKDDLLASLRTKQHQFEQPRTWHWGWSWSLARALPMAGPWRRVFPPAGRRPGGGDHGGKTFLLRATCTTAAPLPWTETVCPRSS